MERREVHIHAICMPPSNDLAFSKDLSDNRDRYIALYILTGILDNHDAPTVEQARDIIRWASRRCA